MESLVRHLTSDGPSQLFGAAEFEEKIHLFEKGKEKKRFSIDTHLDFGGHRIQIIPKANIILAGAYSRFGLEAYDLKSGNLLWKRKDLKKFQTVRYRLSSQEVSCFCDDRAGQIIDIQTGETLDKYSRANDVYFSSKSNHRVEDGSSIRLAFDTQVIGQIKKESFGLLDVAFADTTFAISEVGKSVRICSIETLEEHARYTPHQGYHVLNLTIDEEFDRYVCLLWGYESAGDYFIVHIDQSGKEIYRIPVESGYCSLFFTDRKSFLNADGTEIDWETGQPLCQYEFPKESNHNKTGDDNSE